MNPLDAEPRGIRNGDTVRITSRHGAALRRACVTARIMPGVTTMGEGAWAELDAEGLDRAGNGNTLSGLLPNGQGLCGYNSGIVQVARDGRGLVPDAARAPRIPFGEG